MDSATFDRLTRALATAATRRGVWQALLGLGLGVRPGNETNAKRGHKPRRRDHGGDTKRRGPQRGTSRDRVAAAAIPAEIDYFALGDSIAAGHGLGDEGVVGGRGDWCEPNTGSPPCCRRSKSAYPYGLRQLLAQDGATVVRFEHMACSGAKLPNLAQQIAAVSTQLESSNRPTLVTISIGGNDVGATDPNVFYAALYKEDQSTFDSRILGIQALAFDLQDALESLLAVPGVVVALQEVINPLNQESVFFNAPDSQGKGTMCRDLLNAGAPTYPCWERSETVVTTLNAAFRNRVEFLQSRYPSRIVMTEGLQDGFSEHWGLPGVPKGANGEKECRGRGKKRKCTIPKIYREECGYRNPASYANPDPKQRVSWILSRTGLDAPGDRQNSKPFKPTDLVFRIFNRLREGRLGKATDWKGDCLHPNGKGHEAIASSLAEAIAQLEFDVACIGRDCSGLTGVCTRGVCRQGECIAEPKPDLTACGNGAVCQDGRCLDYGLLASLHLPWCNQDTEPRTLTQDWNPHNASGEAAIGFALDFGRSAAGDSVLGTPLLAPMAGTLQRDPYGDDSGYGHHLRIDHESGWQVILAHLAATSPVANGSAVERGQFVGALGSSGNAEAPHVHVELRFNNGRPTRLFRADAGNLVMFGYTRDDFVFGNGKTFTSLQSCIHATMHVVGAPGILPGACFSIFTYAGDFTEPRLDPVLGAFVKAGCDRDDGNTDGFTTIVGLPPRQIYVALESTAPHGYAVGGKQRFGNLAGGGGFLMGFSSSPSGVELLVRTVDQDNAPVSGACYALYRYVGDGSRREFLTSACDEDDGTSDGTTILAGIDPASTLAPFDLVQIETPEGYSNGQDQKVQFSEAEAVQRRAERIVPSQRSPLRRGKGRK